MQMQMQLQKQQPMRGFFTAFRMTAVGRVESFGGWALPCLRKRHALYAQRDSGCQRDSGYRRDSGCQRDSGYQRDRATGGIRTITGIRATPWDLGYLLVGAGLGEGLELDGGRSWRWRWGR